MAKTPTFRGSGVNSLVRGPETRHRVYMSQHGHRPPTIRPEASERKDVCTLHSGTHLPVQRQMANIQAQQTGATVDNRCFRCVFKNHIFTMLPIF